MQSWSTRARWCTADASGNGKRFSVFCWRRRLFLRNLQFYRVNRKAHLQIGELDRGQVVLVRAQVQPHLVEQLELLHSARGARLRFPLRNLAGFQKDDAYIRNGGWQG